MRRQLARQRPGSGTSGDTAPRVTPTGLDDPRAVTPPDDPPGRRHFVVIYSVIFVSDCANSYKAAVTGAFLASL